MECIQRKHKIIACDPPQKNKRAKSEDKTVNQIQKNSLSLEQLTDGNIGIHIFKNLSPKEFTRLGIISKYFYAIVHNEQVSLGRHAKIAIGQNGYPTYLLTLFLEGEGLALYLKQYLNLIETCKSEKECRYLKKFFCQKLPEITEKVRQNSEAVSVDVTMRIIQLFKDEANNVNIKKFLDYMLTLPDFFVSIFPLYSQLVGQFKAEGGIYYPIFYHPESVIERLSQNMAACRDIKKAKQIYELLLQPKYLLLFKTSTHYRIAALVFYAAQSFSLEIPSKIFEQQTFKAAGLLRLMMSFKAVAAGDENIEKHDAVIKKFTYGSLFFVPYASSCIKQIIFDFLDFSKLYERLKLSEGLRRSIRKLVDSDFRELLKRARSLSSEEAFDALLDIRYPSDDILIQRTRLLDDELNSKIILSVIFNYGRFAKEGWNFLNTDPSYHTISILESIAGVYNMYEEQTNFLMDFLFMAFSKSKNPWYDIGVGPLFNRLSEEEQNLLVSLLFSQKIHHRDKCRLLVEILYPFNYPLDLTLQLASKFSSKQKGNLLEQFVTCRQIIEKKKLSEFIEHFDQIVDRSERDIVYGILMKKNKKYSRYKGLKRQEFSTLTRSLFFVVVPKLSLPQRVEYSKNYKQSKIFDEKDLQDIKI